MKVEGKNYRTVWMEGTTVCMIEQNQLPFAFIIHRCETYTDTCIAIRTMIVRGAGAIGATAGYAMAQAFAEAVKSTQKDYVYKAKKEIEATRPTARNLFYAVDRVYLAGIKNSGHALPEAEAIADEDAEASRRIGEYGSGMIHNGCNIETHCNAGWLAFTDFGTALSPVYVAASQGKKVFVYVDETRPRSQGSRLTAWELKNEGIPHVIIPDNAGAWLMSQGKIDLMIVGADRIAANGDTANKIGTLEKAIVAKEFNVPFYVAAPTSTFDMKCSSGKEIQIEDRSQDEVLFQKGPDKNGIQHEILVCSPGSNALNPAFDVTPARYITGFITEKGIIRPVADAINRIVNS